MTSNVNQVLIVDDDRLFGKTLEMLLEESHGVTYYPSPREALSHLRQGARYDAILCDLMMVEMSGMQFLEALGQVAPELTRRVIFMSGGACTPSAQRFVDQMTQPLLTKPFRHKELTKVLAPFLGVEATSPHVQS
ncbi:response regulator [Hyalangium rubrum]|uniref:Response regulator n=1 Tax=Hyalangium rubrum TaxID=3103134 RepID=A0ABU5HC46_9BACT|nr:response regulator [Hyalangium sp. s54d21]MDY7230836.1 response regulator [Hyalangium sp. s54d21]